jgi:hypothetical protein
MFRSAKGKVNNFNTKLFGNKVQENEPVSQPIQDPIVQQKQLKRPLTLQKQTIVKKTKKYQKSDD